MLIEIVLMVKNIKNPIEKTIKNIRYKGIFIFIGVMLKGGIILKDILEIKNLYILFFMSLKLHYLKYIITKCLI